MKFKLRHLVFNLKPDSHWRAARFVLCVIGIACSVVSILHAQGRPFNVADSIGMQRFTDPFLDRSRSVTSFSPDGRSFFVVTTRGLIDKNLLESTIWLFDVSSEKKLLSGVQNATDLQSKRLVVREGANDSENQERQSAILWPRWSADGRSLLFLGRNGSAAWHLYQLTLKNRELKQLSKDGQDVVQYGESPTTIAYAVAIPWNGPPLPRFVVGTGERLGNLLFPDKHPWPPNSNELWVYSSGQARPVVDPHTHQTIRLNFRFGNEPLPVDPTGRRAIVASAVTSIPESWTLYHPGMPTGAITLWPSEKLKDAESSDIPERLLLVDLKSGKNSFVVDAPRADELLWLGPNKILWSNDGEEVLLSNVFLPLDGVSDAEKVEREQRPAVIAFHVQDSSWTRVTGDKRAAFDSSTKWDVKDVRWGRSTNEVIVTYTEHGPQTEVFHYENNQWDLVREPGAYRNAEEQEVAFPLVVSVKESLIAAPALFASLPSSAEAKQIWNPNPQFANITLAKGEIYNWKDPEGRDLKGVLIKPPHFDPKVRYPLVIEPRAYTQDLFVIDGTYPTAVAAQAMAADGLMILQAGEPHFAPNETFRKGTPAALEGYRSVITKLAAEGLIDPERVGIIGFSRTCDNVMYAITHAPRLFAAATISNGFTYGPMTYFNIVDLGVTNGAMKQWALHYGGAPFGEGESTYLKENAIFNLQKATAPLRVETHGPTMMLTDWEPYAGLRSLGKPVDLIVLPYATHVVSMPADLLQSQQGDVDWFRFWLQGYERPNPEDSGQYKRWEHLRDLRDAEIKAIDISLPK